MAKNPNKQKAFQLITKPIDERNDDENHFIKKQMTGVAYFEKFLAKYGDMNFEYICRSLSGRYYSKGEAVFN
jgi:hypothetical protein